MRLPLSLCRIICAALLATPVAAAPPATTRPADTFDVVVVGGSSGGFAAALAAGRMGARVLLIEDTSVLGGMLSNGVSNNDAFSYASLSGAFEEFRTGLKRYYKVESNPDPAFRQQDIPLEVRRRFGILNIDGRSYQSSDAREGGAWEPRAADAVLKAMIAAVPNVRIVYDTHATNVVMQGRRITGVVAEGKDGRSRTFLGDVVIDATHEGDIAAWAGVPYRIGREARSRLEPHAGVIHFLDETGEIMPGSTGQQDRGIVSYGLRLILKDYGAGKAPPIDRPAGYDRSDFAAAGCDHPIYLHLPGDKFEMNLNPVGNELQGINWDWPEAGYQQRQALYRRYREHALGFLYFLQHDCGLGFGLPDDEFVDNGHVPYRLYVREARRIVGEATMTEADVNPFIAGSGMIPPLRTDSIAIGHYPIDAKPVTPKTDFARPDKSDGDFFLLNAQSAFQVPYGAIVPTAIDGLLVPVAMSATHVAFSAIRMEPTWMAMGHAAGVAAVLALRDKVDVRDVPIEQLQAELLRQHVRLVFYWDVPLDHPAFAAIQRLSVRGTISGYPDREFRPDQPLTRAELASWIVKALDLWPSVSNAHFSDTPYTHPAFRDIETLFDNGLLRAFGIMPSWPTLGGFTPERNKGIVQKSATSGAFGPDLPVRWGELATLLMISRPNPGPSDQALTWLKGRITPAIDMRADTVVTRGDAARTLMVLSNDR